MIYRQLPNGESQYFVYDTENQLAKAEIKKNTGETQTWEYAYDPFGRRLSKERTDKGALQSTAPKRTHFVWDGTKLLQEYTYKGNYTYIYTDQNSYEPLAQVFYNSKDEQQYLAYFHNDQIGIPKEMTDQFGNLVWYGEYTAWGKLYKDERVYRDVHQPFRLQNQYCDEETGLHYNLMRYYEPDSGRFINQDPISLEGGNNLYFFAPNTSGWTDTSGLDSKSGFGKAMLDAVLQGLEQANMQRAGLGRFKVPKPKSTPSPARTTNVCHGNCKNSQKEQHGYKIYDKRTNEVMEYGISGQTRTSADYLKTENNSPRIRSKLRTKYGGNPNYAGSVMVDGLPNRQSALNWELNQVRNYKSTHAGTTPPNQLRPK